MTIGREFLSQVELNAAKHAFGLEQCSARTGLIIDCKTGETSFNPTSMLDNSAPAADLAVNPTIDPGTPGLG